MKLAVVDTVEEKPSLFRWRLKRGGRLMAKSAETYLGPEAALRSFSRVSALLASGTYKIKRHHENPH